MDSFLRFLDRGFNLAGLLWFALVFFAIGCMVGGILTAAVTLP